MRSMFFVLSACSAVAHAAECQAAEEASLLQLHGMRHQQKRMKADVKSFNAKGLVKSLEHIAHNLDTMSTDEVNQALAEASTALATLSPAIQEQVTILQNTVLDAAAAVEACHAESGVTQRAALWEAAEAQAAEVATCEAELATAVADADRICSEASINDVQSECACDEARVRRDDKEELCGVLLTAYENAYCEHYLQCTTYGECHESEAAVYNSIRADVEAEMGPIEDEYVAAQQSVCIMDIIQNAMLTGGSIDFVAIAACSAVDTSPLLMVYPDLPAAPAACPGHTTGSPPCAVRTGTTSDGCLTSNYESGENPTTAQTDPAATAAVRCCSSAGDSCQTQDLPGSEDAPVYGIDGAAVGSTQACINSVTFAEAEAICAEAGRRLCTVAELDSGMCCGTGCWHDHRAIWTSEQQD